jgi:hypothetical protein
MRWYNRGSSSGFVILLAFLIGLSIIMVSGTGYVPSEFEQGTSTGELPTVAPGSSQIIITATPAPGLDNLQLRTFTLITNTPPPPPPAEGNIAECGYTGNGAGGRADAKFDEPEILVDYAPKLPQTTADTQGTITLWAGDESGIVLGVRKINGVEFPISLTPDTVDTYIVGDPVKTLFTGATVEQGAVDTAGRPLFPSLFLTDITNVTDVNSLAYRAGDWQNGGTGIPPHFISGTWVYTVKDGSDLLNSPRPAEKNVVNTIWNLASGGKQPAPGKSYDDDTYFGAEIRWFVAQLTIKKADGSTGPLEAGHTYRAQFFVRDGDQSGSDVAQGCVEIKL